MNLTDAQKQQVSAWISQGLKLAEIQSRLAADLGVQLTYMEVRLLVDDLKLTPKDPEPPKPADLATKQSGPTGGPPPSSRGPAGRAGQKPPAREDPLAGKRGVSVTVDELAKPGAVVSGRVTFSDGKATDWYLDQYGRLGVVPPEPSYKPSAADMQSFQMTLEAELAKLGF
ncbi:MAG: hypothetical protein HYY24_29015 [Verrucomicrobia bacterium]|nr:hypothetical protein [Verrucomicrobiota bacterium]